MDLSGSAEAEGALFGGFEEKDVYTVTDYSTYIPSTAKATQS